MSQRGARCEPLSIMIAARSLEGGEESLANRPKSDGG
jgi:hypothetical protein